MIEWLFREMSTNEIAWWATFIGIISIFVSLTMFISGALLAAVVACDLGGLFVWVCISEIERRSKS